MNSLQRRIARTVALPASAGCACIPLLIRHQGEWTPLKVIAACGAVAAAIALLAMACGPARWWSQAFAALSGIINSSPRTTSARATTWGRGLIVAAGLIAALHIGWRLTHPDDPWDGDDQGAFLDTATEIADKGGPIELFGRLWDGSYGEANRHPLYPGLLSLQPTEEFGRILSATFAALAWIALVTMTWRRFGPVQAGVVALLLAVNATWGYFAGMIVCESLLMLLSVLIWWQCLRLCDGEFGVATQADDPSDKDGGKARTVTRWLVPILLGALLGLNYLTKGTGVVLLGCIIVWFCLEGLVALLSAGRKRRMVAVVTAGSLTLFAFLLVSSPLLARNIKRFGQPFYNINTYLLFADQYAGFEELIARGEPVGQVAREYFATHSAADLLRREASGLMWQTYNIIRMSGPVPLDDARILFGVPLCALAFLGFLRAPPAHRRWLVVWILLQWLVFAWYVAIAAGDRFVLALLPPLLVYAADGIVAVWIWRHPGSMQEEIATGAVR